MTSKKTVSYVNHEMEQILRSVDVINAYIQMNSAVD